MPREDTRNNCCLGVDALKEELHIRLLSRLDLCVIFLLLLRKELRLYNIRSVETLKSLLRNKYALPPRSCSEGRQTLDPDVYDIVQNGARILRWNPAIKHILRKFTKQLGYNDHRDTIAECSIWKLSESDYEYCSTCLKREAVGLKCLLRRCVCKTRDVSWRKSIQGRNNTSDGNDDLEKVKDTQATQRHDDGSTTNKTDAHNGLSPLSSIAINGSSTLESSHSSDTRHHYRSMPPGEHNYDVTACETCSADLNAARVVAVISPFIFKEDKPPSKGAIRSMKRSLRDISNGEAGELGWAKNVELYTKHATPLQSYLGSCSNDPDLVMNKDDTETSINMADRIFDLVETLLSTEHVTSDVKRKPNELVLAISHLLESGECVCADLLAHYREIEGETLGAGIVSGQVTNANNCHTSEDVHSGSVSGALYSDVESALMHEHSHLIHQVNQLVPFPTMYWLTDPALVTQVSALEGNGEITRMQDIINNNMRAFQNEGSLEARQLLEKLIMDNLAYICRRFELVQPAIIGLLYTILVNSIYFERFYSHKHAGNRNFYLTLSDPPIDRPSEPRKRGHIDLAKATAIMNTIRAYGIGGNKSFVHIKCLHTNLAFALAEGSTIGNMVFNALIE
ncbi:hypothetical protein X943_002022 [Babesia divergens]|uniref:Uncharacterized protein n=1 Tax=Babesia divergens TaxID=32595 RepID=A0AAD9G714_BABDI|nr:hypothetical protein X943_002022 [Babesia divergens]